MPRPRSHTICLDATPYYHCTSRCVRRAFLCGRDKNHNFEHRRGWIEDRLLELQQNFCIDVCSYALMSNHYHLVLHINSAQNKVLTPSEIVERWSQLFSLPPLVERFAQGETLLKAQQDVVDEIILTYRERLSSLSWFMRCMNEPIARAANKEDNCTGRFWEGRFSVQALLDEPGLLTCMAYVDLNPVRAKMAKTPEQSDYTSVKARLFDPQIEKQLMPFMPSKKIKRAIESIPFKLNDYLELVDWTGRAIRADKRGSIKGNAPPILERLNIDAQQWIKQHHQLEKNYPSFIGQWQSIQNACEQFKRKWIKGKQYSQLLFSG